MAIQYVGQQLFTKNTLKIPHGPGGVDHEKDVVGKTCLYQFGNARIMCELLVKIGIHLLDTHGKGQKFSAALHGFAQSDPVGGVPSENNRQLRSKIRIDK